MLSANAVAIPVIRFVAPGPLVTAQTPTLPVTRASPAQVEHGDITWFDGVTDEHYENGRFYAAFPPPPHSPFPIIDTTGDPNFEQQSLL